MSKLIVPYHVREDTLAYLKAQPFFQKKVMHGVGVPQVSKMIGAYKKNCGLRSPEQEAVAFYSGNAVWAELLKQYAPDEPLPKVQHALAKWYVKSASLAAQRLMYYLVLILTRESRHVYQQIHPIMAAECGSVYAAFNKVLSSHGSSGAVNHFLANPPEMSLIDYANALEWTFSKGSFSGGFGGEPWRQIAEVFQKLVIGEFSPEMATDVAWTLCHNNGPIFNKGMTYSDYDPYLIKQVLDVQRSGQMPEYVLGVFGPKVIVGKDIENMVKAAMTVFPKGTFGDSVDWVKVENSGAMQSYPLLKKAQLKAQVGSGNLYWVLPDVSVKVFDKKRAA